jgi:hypothetical protein
MILEEFDAVQSTKFQKKPVAKEWLVQLYSKSIAINSFLNSQNDR